MHKQYPAWARLSISTVRMRRWKRLQRPHPLAKQASVLWQRSRSARTLLPDYWQVWTDLASRFARGSVASASACLAGLSKCAALSRRSFDRQCVSSCTELWPEALRPLFFVHTALQFWPILSLVVRLVHSNRAHPRRVSMPSCNDTDYIRKMIVWKIFFVVYSIIILCRWLIWIQKHWGREGGVVYVAQEIISVQLDGR